MSGPGGEQTSDGRFERPALPIDEVMPRLLEVLAGRKPAVLVAPPGAGKTTRVPPALLDSGAAGRREVVVLQPRRLAARAAASRIALERGTPLGAEVGYEVRFERKASARTRLRVVTEGVFLRMLQADPYLDRVGAVVFDEFHERRLDADLALALVRSLRAEARPDLAVVVMSATLAPAVVAEFLGAPIVSSEGRLHPVTVRYQGNPSGIRLEDRVVGTVETALAETTGHVLVFLAGVGEIRRCRAEWSRRTGRTDVRAHELYGDLSSAEQDAVLAPAPAGIRKVIFATNVAETSVTIEGVTAVVDSGMARASYFDPVVGLDRLVLGGISRAAADQRAGRAGRTGPGLCFRLWSEAEHHRLPIADTPEIERVDLAGALLQLIDWGETDVQRFAWFEPPPPSSVERALALLANLGAVEGSGARQRITDLGRRLVRYPAHPRLARLLDRGAELGCLPRAARAAALLSERDPFARLPPGHRAMHRSASDLLDRVEQLEFMGRASAIDREGARRIKRAADQFERIARSVGEGGPAAPDDEATFLTAVAAAFPDRLARRRRSDDRQARRLGVMVGGRGVRLAESSSVMDAELFVCVEVVPQGSDWLVPVASAVERSWLEPRHLSTALEVEFDGSKEAVVAWRRTRFLDLVIEEATADIGGVSQAEVARVLAAAALGDPDRAFALTEPELVQFLARIAFLRQWMPELGLPDWTGGVEGGAVDWRARLAELCVGRRSFAELRRAPMVDVLRGNLSPAQVAALEREAPARWTVPGGRKVPLRYEPGRGPVLAARIQELFGLRQTPRVAAGRVPLVVELLAPNHRPQQVTTDLESFWTKTYPVVRRELARRYPKHAWPENP